MAGRKLELVISGDASGAVGSLLAVDRAAGGTGSRLANFGTLAAGAVAGLAVAGAAAAVGVGVALYKIGSDFDDAYDNIRVKTGATGDELAGLQDDFRAIAAEVPSSFGDISDAVAGLNQRLGLTGEPLQQLGEQMLDLSRLTGTDLTANIGNVTRVFGDWGVATEDQADTVDKLFRATQESGVGLEQLSAQVVQFGAPLRQLGFSLDESIALLAGFERGGVNTSTVMSGMRQAVGRFARDGLSPMEGMQSVMAGVAAGTFTMADAMETFGFRAGPDLFTALQEGRFAIDDLMGAISNGTDTVGSAAEDTEDAGEKFSQMWNQVRLLLEGPATAAFEGIGNAAAWLGQTLTDMSNDPQVQAFFVGIGAKAREVFPKIKAVVDDVVQAFRDNWPEIRDTVVDVFQSISDTASNVAETLTTLWNRFGDDWVNGIQGAIGPILQIIEGAFNVIAGIINTWSAILTGDWSAAWDGIKQAWGGLWGFVQGVFRGLWNALGSIVRVGGELVGQLWFTVWHGIRDFLTGLWESLVEKVQFFMANFGTIVGMWLGRVVSFFMSLPGRVISALSSLQGRLMSAGRAGISALLNGIRNAVPAVLSFMRGLPGQAVSALSGLTTRLLQAGLDAGRGLLNGLRSMTSSIMSWARGVAGDIARSFVDALQIGSPSRVMYEIGVNTMRGLEGGMESHADRPAQIAAGVAASIPAAVPAPAGGGSAAAGVTYVFEFHGPVNVDEDWLARTTSSARRKGLIP